MDERGRIKRREEWGHYACVMNGGLSVPPIDPSHFHHDRQGLDVVEAEGSSAAGISADADDCKSVVGVTPDSARVTASAKRNRLSKAARSCAALSCAAAAFSSGEGLAVPYAHEPTTTAAIVSPCAMMRTRSQLLNECDWPLRIFVMAITSASVVAAAPVKPSVMPCAEFTINYFAPTGTRGCCLNLRNAFSRYVSVEIAAGTDMAGSKNTVWCPWRYLLIRKMNRRFGPRHFLSPRRLSLMAHGTSHGTPGNRSGKSLGSLNTHRLTLARQIFNLL
jgi:hypothetical protein